MNSICDCRNACYILDQMVEMGFSTDGGMVMLQSAFKEAFVVSVVYGKCRSWFMPVMGISVF